MSATFTLARYVLIEARRGGLPLLALACIVIALVLAQFLGAVAITESVEFRSAVVAAMLRACAVFLVTVHVATSTLREYSDKGLELMLSLPVTRSAQYLGRWAGYAAAGAIVALAFAIPLLFWSSPGAVAAWTISLAAETALVAAAALFFSMALVQLVPAVAAVAGFYLVSRAMAALLAIASGPLTVEGGANQWARWVIEVLSLILPRLESVTRTDWLVYGAPSAAELAMALGSLGLYTLLLLAAGLVDFHRRNL